MLNCGLGAEGPPLGSHVSKGDGYSWGEDWTARSPPNQVVSGSGLHKCRNSELGVPRLPWLHPHLGIPSFADKEFYLICPITP